MNKILSFTSTNKAYFSLSIVAALNAYLINYFTTVCNCSISFVLFLFTVNVIQHYLGGAKAFAAAAFALSVAGISQSAVPYYIHGQLMPELIKYSLISTAISTVFNLGVGVVKNGFLIRNLFGTMIAALLDGSIMVSYFSQIYESEIVLNIFIKEVIYKILFTTSLFALSPVLKMIKRR